MATQMMASLETAGNPNAWPVQGQWRYEDYLRLPDDGKRDEIVEGVLYVANVLGYDHQFTVTKLTSRMDVFVTDHKLGVILNAPFEVHLAERSRPVQPDVLFLTTEQQPPPGTQFFEGAPTLIVEVISPSSIRLDRQIKFDAYERAGVAEYWPTPRRAQSRSIRWKMASMHCWVNLLPMK